MVPRLKSPRDHRSYQAFLAALFSGPSRERFWKDLAELTVPEPYRLRMKVLYSQATLTELAALIERHGSVPLASWGPTFRVGAPERASTGGPLALLQAESPSMYVAISICRSREWLTIRRLLRFPYPRLVPVFLSQSELLNAVRRLRERADGYSLRVREVSARERIEAGSIRRARSIREWTDEQIDDALLLVKDRRQILRRLVLGFHKRVADQVDVTPSLLCKVSKEGEVEVTGSFRLAWDTVVTYIAEAGHRKLSFFSNRGLRERQYRSAPLAIVFGHPVLGDVEEVRKLVAALTRYPHSVHAIQHGNPYAHVRVADRYDGSSLDVWAVSPDRLAVIPGLRATEAAIERLVHYVFDHYREGDVAEYRANGRA